MYLKHFGLKKKPFDISPDPEFLWLGEKHREGLAILKYGILENKGFLLITGEVGTGKTALIRSIEKEIDTQAIVVTIPDPGMTLMDFYNYLASELKMERGFQNKGEFLVRFKRLLMEAFSAYKRVLLIIDESQRLDHHLLEEIRLLSNIDMGGKVLINIFFVGQSEFRTLLAKEENRSVRQRITVSYHIAPLSAGETRQYINHRLAVAGATREIITPQAARAVFHFTNGLPRLINIICDHALMSGYSRGLETIDADIIKECAEELRITIGWEMPAVMPPPPVETAKLRQPLPPPPQLARPPRRSRGVWILALFLLLFGAGWYLWREEISDQMARWGKAVVMREPRGATGVPEADPLSRVPPLPVETGPKEPKPADAPAPTAPGEKKAPPEAAPAAPAPTAPAPTAPAPTAPAPTAPAPAATLPSVGIPAPKPPLPARFSAQEFVVFFTQNSADIPIYAFDILAQAVALLNAHPGSQAQLEGHSDSIGNAWINQVVSESRAAAVKSHLVGQGIAAARISTAGVGSEKPIESNDTAEGRGKNRRVVVRVVAGR
jgi:general secretion pathway protein A